MKVLVYENFDHADWQSAWSGKALNAYNIKSRGSPAGLRILFRRGSHYGCDLRQAVPPTRHVELSFRIRVAGDWASHSTGKLPGFADLRHTDAKGRVLGHGNRPPRPNGFSFRTWFGKTANGKVPIGMYVYHAGQAQRWGDTIPVGDLVCGADHVVFRVECDLDGGVVRASLDGGERVHHSVAVGDNTAVTAAWLDGYYGGWRKAPHNMAADIDAYRLDDHTTAEVVARPVSERLRALADEVEALES